MINGYLEALPSQQIFEKYFGIQKICLYEELHFDDLLIIITVCSFIFGYHNITTFLKYDLTKSFTINIESQFLTNSNFCSYKYKTIFSAFFIN